MASVSRRTTKSRHLKCLELQDATKKVQTTSHDDLPCLHERVWTAISAPAKDQAPSSNQFHAAFHPLPDVSSFEEFPSLSSPQSSFISTRSSRKAYTFKNKENTFSCFPRLPSEIRILIWKEVALDRPSLVKIQRLPSSPFVRCPPILELFKINKEARYEARKHFAQFRLSTQWQRVRKRPASFVDRYLHFNPTTQTLLFDTRDVLQDYGTKRGSAWSQVIPLCWGSEPAASCARCNNMQHAERVMDLVNLFHPHELRLIENWAMNEHELHKHRASMECIWSCSPGWGRVMAKMLPLFPNLKTVGFVVDGLFGEVGHVDVMGLVGGKTVDTNWNVFRPWIERKRLWAEWSRQQRGNESAFKLGMQLWLKDKNRHAWLKFVDDDSREEPLWLIEPDFSDPLGRPISYRQPMLAELAREYNLNQWG